MFESRPDEATPGKAMSILLRVEVVCDLWNPFVACTTESCHTGVARSERRLGIGYICNAAPTLQTPVKVMWSMIFPVWSCQVLHRILLRYHAAVHRSGASAKIARNLQNTDSSSNSSVSSDSTPTKGRQPLNSDYYNQMYGAGRKRHPHSSTPHHSNV